MDPRFIFKIIRTCISEKIDIIHIHDPTALTLCVIADRFYGKLPPFVYSKKTSFPIKGRKSTLFKYNYKKIEKYICVSKAVEAVTVLSIKDTNKIATIYNGIRFDNKNTETEFLIKEKYNIPNDKIIIGHIGNHIRAKNLLTFIDVINEIVNTQNNKDFHFVQIGGFTERTPMYFDKIKEFNLENHISFTGFVDNASSFIPQFDMFVLTSQSEGLPQVINEAFYFKIPVVSTNVGGIPEIITDGKNGYLSEINDYKKLSNDLITLSKNKNLQKNFVEKSFAQLMDSFSTEIMAKKTLQVYKTILEHE